MDVFKLDYMVKIFAEYLGGLRCKAVHGPSGAHLVTDAPVDNQGRGEFFSPTDLLAVSLLTCAGTIMGIYAQKYGWDITGMKMEAHKEMAKNMPRRVAKVTVEFWMPCILDEKDRQILEGAVEACPVKQTLSKEVEVLSIFHWK